MAKKLCDLAPGRQTRERPSARRVGARAPAPPAGPMDRCLFRFPSPSCAGFRGSVVQDLPAAVGRVWAHHRTSRAIHSRSEEHTSELQSLMRNSYAVFCLKKKTKKTSTT